MTGDRGITVIVQEAWQASTDVAAFRVRSYLAAMFRELELGAPPALTIAMRAEPGIVFGARTVAFELPVRRDATALGEAIALAIYRCRELLVSESLVAPLRSTDSACGKLLVVV